MTRKSYRSQVFSNRHLPVYNRLIATDPTHAATVKLRFSGINELHTDSDAKLRLMADEAATKTGAKPLIVEKLEKVRGLTKTIEGVGEIVGEVSRLRLALTSNLIIHLATPGHQGSMEGNRFAY